MSQKRHFFTKFPNPTFDCIPQRNLNHKDQKWAITQVTKSNFASALEEIKSHISNSDYIAISLQKTGAFSFPWQKPLPIDTAQTAYLKAKCAAERFQVLQFAVCPFSIQSSKVIAHPYNFHLFPRDELKLRMPSYSFLCQSSYLTSMVNDGFDFNACIRDGISYLSRSQESATKDQTENLLPCTFVAQSELPLTHSVADSVFIQRIKARVKHFTCRESKKTDEDPLLITLRKMISGNELFGSRPCLTIDVCSERQIQLVMEVLKDTVNVVPLSVPSKGRGTLAIRVVLANSKDDKDMLEKELLDMQYEHDKQIRGFRGVIDLVSASQKPIVVHNPLNEFSFVHSKFLAPLPSTVDGFRHSLGDIFPRIIDISHLLKEIGHLKKVKSIPGAFCRLKERSSLSVSMEISQQGETGDLRSHGSDVLRLTNMFARLSLMLELPSSAEADDNRDSSLFESYVNIFSPHLTNFGDPFEDDIQISSAKSSSISSRNLVLLWGFEGGMSARKLKELLKGSHEVFSQEFNVRLVDLNCAAIVFLTCGFADRFLELMNSGGMCCEPLREMIADGVRGSGYRTYVKVFELGFWDANLPDALDKVVEETEKLAETNSKEDLLVTYWNNEDMIDLDSL